MYSTTLDAIDNSQWIVGPANNFEDDILSKYSFKVQRVENIHFEGN